MLGEICQFFAIDSSNFPSNDHIIIGNRSCQSDFLVHFFLNLCEKQNRPVVFLGLSQSFGHYNSVGQKLGNNLGSARDERKSLVFLESLFDFSESIASSSTFRSTTAPNPFVELLKGDSTTLLKSINASLETLAQIQTGILSAPVVIIDDLSVLLSAGVAPECLLLFVNSLHELVTSPRIKGSLIISLHLDKEDEKAEELWAYLTHLSTVKVQVTDLASGYCRDVHGEMHAEWRDSHDKPRKSITRHTQFKLSDKNISLFAPGMSAAVL
ncbi:unnamed protein product [Candidula unifasciata]|uniref:Elongator complex protein 6 n=1 Tax=Candidula unifasciata TaxID=100452 RepID=A0A8S3YWU3_9EUPU|nr:unnamed protein product [Candidula unifasciata]